MPNQLIAHLHQDILNRFIDLIEILVGNDDIDPEIAPGEGGKKGSVKKITLANLDKNQYPNEDILAPLRQALAKRDGLPLQKLLADMQASRIEVLPEKKQKSPRQPTKELATMENTHDRHTVPTPSISHSGAPSAAPGQPTTGASPRPTPDFWEPSSPTVASPNRA